MSKTPAESSGTITPAESTIPAAPADRRSHPRARLAVVCLVIAGAVGFLLVKGLGSSLDYFKTVDEAAASKAQIGTTVFRLEGTVTPGSVNRTLSGTSFDIGQGARRFHVVNVGTPPQLFKATMPVIVVGHFASATSSTFLSNQIMVKHSASYVAAHPSRVRAGDGSVN